MKKTKKKLVLAKETVRSLSAVDLKDIAGGTTWQATCAGCGGSNYNSCEWICYDEIASKNMDC
ncbi:MAG TPA: class I lanthipeptide [Thermoanaerobaculia bacterium]|jgi:hypothetical protein|nr:class I lanthipeptide [Thermoanaerobaculia bacterium]